MNELQIFKNDTFGEVRVTEVNGEPMFCLADVAKALGYSNPAKAVIDHCKGVTVLKTPTSGGVQSIKFGKEGEVYRLTMKSKLPNAEKFQDWICDEVLPSIRKTGGYSVQNLSRKDLALMVIKAEEEKERLMLENKEQAEKIQEDAPKVNFANAIVGCSSSCLIGELAKVLTQNGCKIGQNRLFEWMRRKGYLGTHGERYNIPNQQYVEMGLFELKKGSRSGNDGVLYTTLTTKVTTKGQMYFVNKLVHNREMFN